MMGFGLIGSLLVLVLIFVAGAALLRQGGAFFSGQGSTGNSAAGSFRDANQILDERYARGEINREEYQQIKTDLQN